jgi:signal recognition particle receptor subunit beta
MKEHKIIITGSMGAGKTTAIGAVSEVPPIVTDVKNNDHSVDKALTTVGFDYGQLTLDNGDRIRLFGTPGQARFRFVWQAVSKGALGLIILTDNTSKDPLADLRLYLEGFAQELQYMPCVIGVGRSDTHPVPGLDVYAMELERAGYLFPVVPVDVRCRDDVVMLIDVLLSQLEADLL